MTSNHQFLKNVLRFNALFSSLCALTLLFFAVPIAEFMGEVASWILILLAIGLLSFVVMILLISEKNSINKKQAKLITILDLGWVLVSILILLLSPQWFTSEGIAIVLIVATIVACLAYFQVLGLKKYNSI